MAGAALAAADACLEDRLAHAEASREEWQRKCAALRARGAAAAAASDGPAPHSGDGGGGGGGAPPLRFVALDAERAWEPWAAGAAGAAPAAAMPTSEWVEATTPLLATLPVREVYMLLKVPPRRGATLTLPYPVPSPRRRARSALPARAPQPARPRGGARASEPRARAAPRAVRGHAGRRARGAALLRPRGARAAGPQRRAGRAAAAHAGAAAAGPARGRHQGVPGGPAGGPGAHHPGAPGRVQPARALPAAQRLAPPGARPNPPYRGCRAARQEEPCASRWLEFGGWPRYPNMPEGRGRRLPHDPGPVEGPRAGRGVPRVGLTAAQNPSPLEGAALDAALRLAQRP